MKQFSLFCSFFSLSFSTIFFVESLCLSFHLYIASCNTFFDNYDLIQLVCMDFARIHTIFKHWQILHILYLVISFFYRSHNEKFLNSFPVPLICLDIRWPLLNLLGYSRFSRFCKLVASNPAWCVKRKAKITSRRKYLCKDFQYECFNTLYTTNTRAVPLSHAHHLIFLRKGFFGNLEPITF